MICGRCKKEIPGDEEREFCWYCQADLCYDCWDDLGHCGHAKAYIANVYARRKDLEMQHWKLRHGVYDLITFLIKPLTWTSDDRYFVGWWPALKGRIHYAIEMRMWHWAVQWKGE